MGVQKDEQMNTTPVVNITYAFLPDSEMSEDEGKLAVAPDGMEYLCCCTRHEVPGAITCELTPANATKKKWWKSDCGGIKGVGWHSWTWDWDKSERGLINAGSCTVKETDPLLSQVLTTSTTTTTITTTTTTTTLDDVIVEMGGSKYRQFGNATYKCCCSSDKPTDVAASKKQTCGLFKVEKAKGCKALVAQFKDEEDAREGALKEALDWLQHILYSKDGEGYHSWNNMGEKYDKLKNYGECALPPGSTLPGPYGPPQAHWVD
jgi:hypothetical protein